MRADNTISTDNKQKKKKQIKERRRRRRKRTRAIISSRPFARRTSEVESFNANIYFDIERGGNANAESHTSTKYSFVATSIKFLLLNRCFWNRPRGSGSQTPTRTTVHGQKVGWLRLRWTSVRAIMQKQRVLLCYYAFVCVQHTFRTVSKRALCKRNIRSEWKETHGRRFLVRPCARNTRLVYAQAADRQTIAKRRVINL